MKRVVVCAITVLMLLAATCAPAQSSFTLKADIPFDFTVGKETLTAGEYTLVSGIAGGPATILLRGNANRSGAFLLTNVDRWGEPEEPQAQLVFHRYGDRYFLAELWTADGEGRRVLMSKEERELAQEPSPMQVASISLRPR